MGCCQATRRRSAETGLKPRLETRSERATSSRENVTILSGPAVGVCPKLGGSLKYLDWEGEDPATPELDELRHAIWSMDKHRYEKNKSAKRHKVHRYEKNKSAKQHKVRRLSFSAQ
ncbi:uncharacterized protein LOC135830469 [Sycon ciliatum]|uniref:uncharacterized protein LOC135830469 n=1 Tax=Sycon ciliatum TaxID=27933 RepID=UPI0031F6B336